MAYLQKNPLKGEFADASMFFLKDNGFVNREACSNKSVWVGKGIQLFIDPEDIVMTYDKLNQLIYDSGVTYGKWFERRNLTNVMTTFIQNYGKENEDLDY